MQMTTQQAALGRTIQSRTPSARNMPEHEITLLSLLQILQKRRWIVILAVALGLAGGVVDAMRPAQYTAVGSIRIHPGSSSMYDSSPEKLLTGGDTDDRIGSEVMVLQSKSLLLSVATQLDLVHDSTFLHKKFGPGETLADPAVRSYVLAFMSKHIKVERVPKTDVLTLSCTSGSAMESTKVVNALSQAYLQRLFDSSFSSTQRASHWLTGQLGDLKETVEKDQGELVKLQGRLGVVGFDDGHNLVTSQLETLAKANAEASLQRIVAEARYRILEGSDADLIEGGPALLSTSGSGTAGAGSLLQNLRNSQAQLASRFAELDAQFGANYPDVKQVKAQLTETTKQVEREQTRVLSQAQVSYKAARSNESMTQQAFARQKQDALQKSDEMVKYEILLHEYQVNRTLYEGMTERLREAGIVSGLASNEVDIVDMAEVPWLPSSAARWVTVAVSGVLGFVAGVLLVLLVEALDTSIGSSEDLSRLIDLPSLAVLPRIEKKQRSWRRQIEPGMGALLEGRKHEVALAPNSPFSEGIRSLRTALMMSRAARPPKVILFTSAVPGEGKSTVSGNMARLLAQYSSSVLLIDADLRIPSQHRQFQLSNEVGLTSVLTGAAKLQDAVQSVEGVSRLQVLTSGPLTSSPGVLVGSETMRQLIAECAGRYEYVLLDSPPCATISDALLLGQFSEAIVLIVREGLASKKTVRRVAEKLSSAGTLLPGFVMNAVPTESSEYAAYYGEYGAYLNQPVPQAKYMQGGTV